LNVHGICCFIWSSEWFSTTNTRSLDAPLRFVAGDGADDVPAT
jgi:hypothetical protein